MQHHSDDKHQNEDSRFFEAICKSITQSTTIQEILDFIEENIFPKIKNYISNDNMIIVPEVSMAVFELNNDAADKLINIINANRENLQLNGHAFILRTKSVNNNYSTNDTSKATKASINNNYKNGVDFLIAFGFDPKTEEHPATNTKHFYFTLPDDAKNCITEHAKSLEIPKTAFVLMLGVLTTDGPTAIERYRELKENGIAINSTKNAANNPIVGSSIFHPTSALSPRNTGNKIHCGFDSSIMNMNIVTPPLSIGNCNINTTPIFKGITPIFKGITPPPNMLISNPNMLTPPVIIPYSGTSNLIRTPTDGLPFYLKQNESPQAPRTNICSIFNTQSISNTPEKQIQIQQSLSNSNAIISKSVINNNHPFSKNEVNNVTKDVDDEESKAETCLHSNECSRCSYSITQKQEQIRLLKGFTTTLQKQNEYHTNFQKLVFDAMEQGSAAKKGKKSKTKRKRHRKKPQTNHSSYDSSYRIKKNIKISKRLTNEIIPTTIKEPISNVYEWIDKSVGLQYNDGQINDQHDEKNDVQIVNLDFHHITTNEPLYCIYRKLENDNEEFYKWKMDDRLYTADEIPSSKLPQSSRNKASFVDQINHVTQIALNHDIIQNIVDHCKWRNIQIFSRKNNKNRMTLSILEMQLKKNIKDSVNTDLIPIVMFDDNSHWIEHIWIANIAKDIDIGIAIRYDIENGIRITGIHLDKEYIKMAHELVATHDCKCLDGFESIIHDIQIGNPDSFGLNQMKSYKQRYETIKQFIYKFMDENEKEGYESLKNDAKIFMKHDNGTLKNWIVPHGNKCVSSSLNDEDLII